MILESSLHGSYKQAPPNVVPVAEKDSFSQAFRVLVKA